MQTIHRTTEVQNLLFINVLLLSVYLFLFLFPLSSFLIFVLCFLLNPTLIFLNIFPCHSVFSLPHTITPLPLNTPSQSLPPSY
jgi:hypothetical protein